MKSPDDISRKLVRQWENRALREERLLGDADVWPLCISIGKPKPEMLRGETGQVRDHIRIWREVSVGKVEFEEARYRALLEPMEYPARWVLEDANEWVRACGDRGVRGEFDFLERLLEVGGEVFGEFLVRRRGLWRGMDVGEACRVVVLAGMLEPLCAGGVPLRAFSVGGEDSKFFERNRGFLVGLLDVRFDGEVSRLGLEGFLGAEERGGLWPLVVDLGGGVLPVERMRVRVEELEKVVGEARGCLIVENENCLHLLPRLEGVVAVMGCGMNLAWTGGEWLRGMRVGYWGDLDSWGLRMLGVVRRAVPGVEALLMTREVFEAHLDSAVEEPVSAGEGVPEGLSEEEGAFYLWLLECERGRLEQEFLGKGVVGDAVSDW